MNRVVRLMSDWSLEPVYINLDDGNGYELSDLEDLTEIFGVPEHVLEAIRKWNSLYEAILNWDDPYSTKWPSAETEARYLECGRAVSRLLRRHLPDDVAIDLRFSGTQGIEYF